MSQLPRIQSPETVEQLAQQSASFPDLYASRILINPQTDQDGIPVRTAVELVPYDYDNDLFPNNPTPWRMEIEDAKTVAAVRAAQGDSSLQDALGAVANSLKALAQVREIADAMQKGRVVEISADTETGEIVAEGSGS